MKKTDDDKLRNIFREMNLNTPSPEFENRLMQQIQVVADKQQKRKGLKSRIYNICTLIAGTAAIIGFPLIIFYFFEIQLPQFDYNLKLPQFSINPIIILIAISVLFLVIADTLIRKYMRNKHYKS